MSEQPRFEFHVDGELSSRLLIGTASPGMAGLVAVDHLVSTAEAEQIGHATARNLPSITPFSEGVPRYPIRLYDTGSGPSVLVCETILPVGPGELFADAVGELTGDTGVEEVTVLYGIPYPHGPDDHAVFSVATEQFPTERLRSVGVSPLGGGFLDGYVSGLLTHGMDSETPAVGTLVTPSHPPGPDFEGALRLLEAVATHYDVDIETGPLEERSEEIRRYYAELADRMNAMSDDDADLPEDRMYM